HTCPREHGVMAMTFRAKRDRECAPLEVMQLVARRRHLSPADNAAVGGGVGVAVQHSERILRPSRGVESGNIGELLGCGRNGGGWTAVERGIHCRHDSCLLATSHPTAARGLG